MSFMFNPHPYDDLTAINRPKLSDETKNAIISGVVSSAKYICDAMVKRLQERGSCVAAFDGYAGADFSQFINLASQMLKLNKVDFEMVDISTVYKSSKVIEEQLKDYLPTNRVVDPVLLFGKIYKGDFEDFFDMEALNKLINCIKENKNKVIIVYGIGSCAKTLQDFYDIITYLDVTPKQVSLRAKNGLFKNIGDDEARPFKELMRRCYYVDFELAAHLRGNLLKAGKIDNYIMSDNPDNIKLIPKKALDEILSSLAKYPFRCKPVYLEGVWGGEYVRKIRKLPKEMKNCAWAFDLIPLEVSILVEAGDNLLEFPYFTFVQKEGEAIMGKECVEKFGGYFPIRFNYDDTFHSSGNMSIQVHPVDKYVKENNGEFGRQDESYYVVAIGHGAKTYLGFKEDADVDEFIREVKKSEKEFTPVDYEKYVNSVPSTPGIQFMIPAGTIHASGRNQVVLEIGSLTVGSYTYKMYDYLRADLDGVPRPIHTYHGERVVDRTRKTGWVKENLVQPPRKVRGGDGWAEYIVGEHDLLYFSLRRLEFEKEIEDDTNGKFHVLTLVDGEKVLVQSLENPELCYTPNYLDVIVVPASIGKYVIKNLGVGPVCIHKTMLKDGFYEQI